MLIAHNVCSLNKNLALTGALHQLRQTDFRQSIWHTTSHGQRRATCPNLFEGYPWDLLRTDWGNLTHVVVSELRRDELAELMSIEPASIRVIPNGVNAEEFYKLEALTESLLEKTNLLEAAPILILPVRITPRKNIELALNTLAALKRDFPQAALVVTGSAGSAQWEQCQIL
ncbi:MAG: hypothetical protein U0X87_08900 [Anaerolineales bacterium]